MAGKTRKTSPTVRKGRPPKGWKERFLKILADVGNVRAACLAAGVDRSTAYAHQGKDEAFAEAWENAIEESVDLMELEARRRGMKGVERPIYHAGEQVGTVMDYSDTLLIFLMKAHRPEKYRDNYQLNALIEQLATARDAAPKPAPTGSGRGS